MKMVRAWWLMAHTRTGVEISEGEYGVLKREWKKAAAKNSGWHHSDETRRKFHETRKGRKAWNKGMKMPEWMVKKNSEAHKGKPSPNKGKPRTEEQKRKQSESMKRRYANGMTPWNKRAS